MSKTKYIGSESKKGVIIRGRLWATPWKWSADEIAKNIAAEPKLKPLFGIEEEEAKGSTTAPKKS